jgi:hypothetical protein
MWVEIPTITQEILGIDEVMADTSAVLVHMDIVVA